MPRATHSLPSLALLCAALTACGGGSSSGGGGSNLSITTLRLPDATLNASYQATIASSGANGATTFTIASGNLPQGLTLSSGSPNATISGTPSAAGLFTFTVQVSDGAGGTAQRAYSLSVARRQLLFLGDAVTDTISELFIVDTSGSVPSAAQRVNGPLVAGGEVDSNPISEELFSPNGLNVAYVADQDSVGVLELYIVDVSAATPAAPVKISGSVVGGGVVDFRWAPDSQSIAFLAELDNIGIPELYLVDLSGMSPGAPVKVSGTLPAGYNVQDKPAIGRGEGYDFHPNGDSLSFIAESSADPDELYFVDLRGASPAAPVKLNGPMVTGGEVFSFVYSFSGRLIAYNADQDTDDTRELYLVDISSGAPLAANKVSAAFPAGATGLKDDQPFVDFSLFASDSGYAFAPDETGIAYLAVPVAGSAAEELFFVSLSGAQAVSVSKVNPTLVDPSSEVNSFLFSPDASSIVYNADQETIGVDELYVARLQGGNIAPAQKLNAAFTTPGNGGDASSFINGNGYFISNDGRFVVYRADDVTNGVEGLFVVDISGPAPTTAVQINAAGTDSTSSFFDSTGTRVLYTGEDVTPGERELFLFDLTSMTRTRLSGALVGGGDVQLSFAGFQFSPDDQRVAYRADQDVDNDIELYVVDISTLPPGAAVKVNPTLVAGGDIANFAWAQR